ncbi:MAG: 3-deoxy-manno-octulosonate cytidylyltransferase [Bacteroidota bacterium]
MQYIGIIPARYASQRFPGKPLVKIKGVSMIKRVFDQAKKTNLLSHVLVATDDERIYDHVNEFGDVVLTSSRHPSGTDRCFEAARKISATWGISDTDVIVNIQGDEPYIQPHQIEQLCSCFHESSAQIATLIKKIDDPDSVKNPNIVKVVSDKQKQALYFSRSPIPYFRNTAVQPGKQIPTYYKHIGMYAYRYGVLRDITQLPPSDLECTESLEQLRWLENGFVIKINVTETESLSIDTPADLNHFV